MPQNFTDFYGNFLIILTNHSNVRLVPPAWALTVEIFFYILIGIGITKSKKLTVLFFISGLFYTIIVNILGCKFYYKYSFVFAASLPFSTGGMIYHYKNYLHKRLTFIKNNFATFILFTVFIFNIAASQFFLTANSRSYIFFFYFNLVISALLILSLSAGSLKNLIPAKLDKIIGDYSYPIYLIHWQAGFISTLIFPAIKKDELELFFVSVPIILIFSTIIIFAIEHPVDKLRIFIYDKFAKQKPVVIK